MSAPADKTISDPDIIEASPDEVICLEKCYPLHYRVFQELVKSGKAKITEPAPAG